MGAPRRKTKAVMVAVLLCASARAEASVQVDPIARLSLEGGYDSNVLFNAQGGGMGRVSPDLGFRLRDPSLDLGALVGGDLLSYPQNGSAAVWNQRAKVVLHAKPSERFDVDSNLNATYAMDPIGLARLGIFGVAGAGLVTSGRAAAGYRLDRLWKLTGFFEEYLVRFDVGGTGGASHTPGMELSRRIGRRLELGAVYKYDFFEGIGPGTQNAHAQEAQALLRYVWTRRLTLEVQAGSALWTSPQGTSSVVPEGFVQLLPTWRGGGARFTVHHGVGLGLTAVPGLFDSVEAGVASRIGKYFEVHADGGLWRSGSIPWGGPNPELMYGIEGSLDYRVAPRTLLGIDGARYQRVDVTGPLYTRNIVGLHVTWELTRTRPGGP